MNRMPLYLAMKNVVEVISYFHSTLHKIHPSSAQMLSHLEFGQVYWRISHLTSTLYGDICNSYVSHHRYTSSSIENHSNTASHLVSAFSYSIGNVCNYNRRSERQGMDLIQLDLSCTLLTISFWTWRRVFSPYRLGEITRPRCIFSPLTIINTKDVREPRDRETGGE